MELTGIMIIADLNGTESYQVTEMFINSREKIFRER